ncbi:MAG TPA: CapA family protein [Acidimicrobiales bacterium]|nr:CapA family protein [Acidimicrobiales bacterium]
MVARGTRLILGWTALVLVALGIGVAVSTIQTAPTGPDPAGIATVGAPTTNAAVATTTPTTTEPTTTTAVPTTTVPTTTTTTTTTLPPARSVTLAFTGDLIPHNKVIRQAISYGRRNDRSYDFGPMFDDVRSHIESADLAICHMETPIRADRGPSGFPRFNAPIELAEAVAGTGYDGCSTASNHAYDQGTTGVIDTVTALEEVGLGSSGMARTAEERETPTLYTTESGVVIAHISATEQLNGARLPSDAPYLVRRIDPETILADAAAARAAGADIVVLSLHWGVEQRVDPTPFQVETAATLLASPDVDLIVGHHAHTVQPIGRVGDKYVVYGIGNFLTNQLPSCCGPGAQDGVIVEVTLSEVSYGEGFTTTGIDYVPTWVDRSNFVIVDIPTALADPELTGYPRTVLENSRARTERILNDLRPDPDEGAGWLPFIESPPRDPPPG